MRNILFFIIKFILGLIGCAIVFFGGLVIFSLLNKKLANKVYIRLVYYVFKNAFFANVKYLNLDKLDKNKNYIMISNHQSYFDIIILGFICQNNSYIIAKDSLKYYPILGLMLYLGGNFLIKRGNSEQSKLILHQVMEKIKAQKASIYIYPQGTRVFTNKVTKLKKGFIRIAQDTEIDILPYVISSYKLNDILFSFRNKNPILVKIGEPISYKKSENEILEEVTNLMKNTISELDAQSNKAE